jgi:hypothetical protein
MFSTLIACSLSAFLQRRDDDGAARLSALSKEHEALRTKRDRMREELGRINEQAQDMAATWMCVCLHGTGRVADCI